MAAIGMAIQDADDHAYRALTRNFGHRKSRKTKSEISEHIQI
jgi:hypothetical protein